MRALRLAAAASLAALALLCFAWEAWLAPLRPGGSLMVLKAFPLLAGLPGILAGRRYTYQWMSLLSLAYFAEGVVRTWSERALSQRLAAAELALSVALFALVVAYARLTRRGA